MNPAALRFEPAVTSRAVFLVALLSLVCTAAQATPSAARVFPVVPAEIASPHYEVFVFIDGEWRSSFVNFDKSRTDGNGSRDESGRTFNWTTFETSASVAVRVRRLEGGGATATLRPMRYGLKAKPIDDSTIEFVVSPGQKVSVEFDTAIKNSCFTGPPDGVPCIKNSMLVFADVLKGESAIAGVPKADIHAVVSGKHEEIISVSGGANLKAGRSTLGDCGGKRVVVFPPGVYDIGYWQVPNNVEHIHLEAGAVVYGAIDVIPLGRDPFYDAATIRHVYRDHWSGETLRPKFALTGSGIISGAKLPWHLKKDFSYTSNDDWWAHVKLVQLAVEQITLEDVTVANSPYWVLSFLNDADRRTRGVFDNFKMVGAWTYNNDGLPNPTGSESRISNAFIHADDDAFKIYNSESSIDNCVVWQSNNGAVFQFGWFPKSVSDVRISNIDVIHFENWYGVQQVNRAVFNYAKSRGNGVIRDVHFDSVHVEGPILRLFGMDCGERQVIRNFTFDNLKVFGGMGAGRLGPPGANYFFGAISEFRFNDFVLGDTCVRSAAEAEIEFGNGAGAGFSFNAKSSKPAADSTGPIKAVPD